jgi:3-oxoadipate enol-lactonase / 4-carboxymuconolactone decarboxylase
MPIHTINNVALHYEERGDRSKPSLVLAGPLLFGAQGFDPLVPLLENDFYLVRLDVHGHGRSGLRVPLILEDMAEDFRELLLRLGLPKPVWVGHSIGGMLGMRIAHKYPDELAALILIAATARPDPPALREQTWQLWQAFRAGQRATIAEPALPFFFARVTFHEQPELIRRYRDWIVNFRTQRMLFNPRWRYSTEPILPSFCLALLHLLWRSPEAKILPRRRRNCKSSPNGSPMRG